MKPLILIADDRESNRHTLRELLADQDYQIAEAADGEAALRSAVASPPDLVLLDVMMPGMDGFEVCRRLRADSHLAEVPIILITALDDPSSRLLGAEAGADDFITKPFNRAELRARVRTITRLNRYRRLIETQAQLRESELRFQKLAEHSQEVFWFHTVDPIRITFISPAVKGIWGLDPERFYEDAQLWPQSIYPGDLERVKSAYQAVFSGETDQFTAEYRVVRPDGEVRWVLDSGTPIRDPDGTIVSFGGVARDITEKKQLEAQFFRAQRLESLGMLAAGIAHDLNNVLAPVLMGAAILRTQTSNERDQNLLSTIEASAERGAQLVKQILSFAHGTKGDRVLIQAKHLLRDIADLANHSLPKSIAFETDMTSDLWTVRGNSTQLHQVLLNLCVNARDAMPDGGTLRIVAENRRIDANAANLHRDASPGAYLMFEVTDTGGGIPAEVIAAIWEPFFTTKAEDKGTGLGLSTVRGIIANHGGFVQVESEIGSGTTFRVFLPAAEQSVVVDSPPEPGQPQMARGTGELIMVVDDESSIRQLAVSILSRFGYRVITATDGNEAMDRFIPRVSEIDLVITDLSVPGMSGDKLVVALSRIRSDIKVLFMSGADAAKATLDLGGIEFGVLNKPFTIPDLLTEVRSILDRIPANSIA